MKGQENSEAAVKDSSCETDGFQNWTNIIDKQGVVRFNDFNIEAGDAIELIERRKQESTG